MSIKEKKTGEMPPATPTEEKEITVNEASASGVSAPDPIKPVSTPRAPTLPPPSPEQMKTPAEKKQAPSSRKRGEKPSLSKAKESPTPSKPPKKKGTKTPWAKKTRIHSTPEAKTIQSRLVKKNKPAFHGRFGKKNIRSVFSQKFGKWRFPRGSDILLKRAYGALVKVGYRTPKTIRELHPSGYPEVLIRSSADLDKVPLSHVVRLSSTLGRKKRIAIIQKANERKIRILN